MTIVVRIGGFRNPTVRGTTFIFGERGKKSEEFRGRKKGDGRARFPEESIRKHLSCQEGKFSVFVEGEGRRRILSRGREKK